MLECNFCKAEASQFYTSANQDGTWSLYCSGCYQKFVLDNYQGIVPYPIKPHMPDCECGTHAPRGQNHSAWCDLYKRDF